MARLRWVLCVLPINSASQSDERSSAQYSTPVLCIKRGEIRQQLVAELHEHDRFLVNAQIVSR